MAAVDDPHSPRAFVLFHRLAIAEEADFLGGEFHRQMLDADPDFSVANVLAALVETDLVVNYHTGTSCPANRKRGQDEEHS